MAIKPNEIRTGNLFLYDIGIEYDEAHKWEPTALDWQDIKWCEENNQDFNSVHKPMPITEELLLKLGFELEYKSEFTIKYTMPDASIGYDWGKMDGWSFRYFGDKLKCDYVHQLQNLVFALKGTELVLSAEGEKI